MKRGRPIILPYGRTDYKLDMVPHSVSVWGFNGELPWTHYSHQIRVTFAKLNYQQRLLVTLSIRGFSEANGELFGGATQKSIKRGNLGHPVSQLTNLRDLLVSLCDPGELGLSNPIATLWECG